MLMFFHNLQAAQITTFCFYSSNKKMFLWMWLRKQAKLPSKIGQLSGRRREREKQRISLCVFSKPLSTVILKSQEIGSTTLSLVYHPHGFISDFKEKDAAMFNCFEIRFVKVLQIQCMYDISITFRIVLKFYAKIHRFLSFIVKTQISQKDVMWYHLQIR